MPSRPHEETEAEPIDDLRGMGPTEMVCECTSIKKLCPKLVYTAATITQSHIGIKKGLSHYIVYQACFSLKNLPLQGCAHTGRWWSAQPPLSHF